MNIATLDDRRRAFKSVKRGFISESSFNKGWDWCNKFYRAQLPKPYENEIIEPLKTPLG